MSVGGAVESTSSQRSVTAHKSADNAEGKNASPTTPAGQAEPAGHTSTGGRTQAEKPAASAVTAGNPPDIVANESAHTTGGTRAPTESGSGLKFTPSATTAKTNPTH